VSSGKTEEVIMIYIKRKYNLVIGDETAKRITIALGLASETEDIEIKGRDLISGTSKTMAISKSEIREVLDDRIVSLDRKLTDDFITGIVNVGLDQDINRELVPIIKRAYAGLGH
jgi:actin-like ATPase involved in cell morphogenesis